MIGNIMFLIQGTIEITGLIAFGLAIARCPIEWVRVLLVAAALAIVSYIIQSLSFFFGFHSLLIMFLIILYITKTGEISVIKGFLMMSISSTVLVMLEFMANYLYFNLSNLNPQAVVSNQFLWAALGIPQSAILVLFAILISKKFKPTS